MAYRKNGTPLSWGFSEADTQRVVRNPGKFLQDCAEKNNDLYVTVMVTILMHYSTHDKHVGIIIDDTDNYTTDLQRQCLNAAQSLYNNELKVVLALRVSSWNLLKPSIDTETLMPTPPNINWNYNLFEKILVKRAIKCKKYFIMLGKIEKSQLT